MRRRAVAGILFAVLSRTAAAQGPSADWRTLETAHFRVHFPAAFEPWARHVAELLEPMHVRVAAYTGVGVAPGATIDVVVADPAADSNGVAVPFLDRPEMILWASPPSAESGLSEFPDWGEILATHELAHIVHLARPGNGAFAGLQRYSPVPLGPLALGSPRWLYEGYATLVEGALTGSGRPASTLRAMVLRQLGIEGKLPSYGKLDGGGGWLGEAMPYLVGSAYLEWLAAREGESSLPKLWTRMAAHFAGGFDASFRETFGGAPEDLYDRFVAETTARAVSEEEILEAAGLASGDLVLRLEGATSSPQVSPDGKRLLARRDPSRRESYLAVWDLTASDTARAPRWKLPRHDTMSAADPRWLPGGESVLFSRRAPDADGVLHWDLYAWSVERGSIARLTRGQDVSDADPSPDGRFAVGVRSRFGATALVRVDLATGQTREIPVDTGIPDGWPVWSSPRVSPDGGKVAALLHAGRRWRLVVLAVEGGTLQEVTLPGAPAGAPAWSPDGSAILAASDGTGAWNLVRAVVEGVEPARVMTRVTGGASSPAPYPDGTAVVFLDWTAHGVDVRRLDTTSPGPPRASDRLLEAVPRTAPAPLGTEPVAAARPYSVWPSQTIRPLVNFSIGPDGDTVQIGLDGADVLGRFHWLAAGSFGNTPGPRGGTAAAAWRGWPVTLSAQLFSALEIPGRQSLAPRPALDADRSGGYVGGSWGRPFIWGRVDVDAGGGAASIQALSEDRRFSRALGTARGRLAARRTTGRWGAGLDLEAWGTVGETRGFGWSQWSGGVRPAWITPFATLSVSGRWGGSGGTPSRFDAFAIGGSPSTILPPAFDRNRIENPALPFAVQLGTKFESYRAAVETSSAPIVVYGEWSRAWSAGELRPDPVRAAGAEARLERLVPGEFRRTLTFRVGAAWIDSPTPRFRTVRGYADLIYRP